MNAISPTLTAFCTIFAPITLDVVIPVIFAAYGFAILLSIKRNQHDFALARLDAGNLPAHVWSFIGVVLILSALSDILIAIALANQLHNFPPLVISIFSSAALLSIGIFSVSPNVVGEEGATIQSDALKTEITEEDTSLMQRLDTLLVSQRMYLDPSLTLTRLAHKLHVPIKQLSIAINKTTGENVSRYINTHRIKHACRELENGADVTSAMLESGFNTKSNFNREFKRITGQSPSDWLQDNQSA